VNRVGAATPLLTMMCTNRRTITVRVTYVAFKVQPGKHVSNVIPAASTASEL
jgi:hypothetical protein